METDARPDEHTASPFINAPSDPEGFTEYALEWGLGDGLPLLPPTAPRVDAMLTSGGLSPNEIIAMIPPRNGGATAAALAANAVMAGCLPELFPFVVAGIRAMSQGPYNLYALQTTTNAATMAVVVSGPGAQRYGFNGGANCLGQGNRANATVGRALRLALMNIGGAHPGGSDGATQGQPAKFGFCFAENRDESPWPGLHEDAGLENGASFVTAFTACGTVNLLESTSSAAELLRAFGRAIQSPNDNDYIYGGEPWLVLGPEHAKVLASAGLSKHDVQVGIWENSKMPARAFSLSVREHWVAPAWRSLLGEVDGDTLVPIAPRAEDVRIVVAGGPSGHSTFIPSTGFSRAVSCMVEVRPGNHGGAEG